MRVRSISPGGLAEQVAAASGAEAEGRPTERPRTGSKVDWWLWPAAAAASGELLMLALVIDLGSPGRPIAALVFLSIGPGASMIPLLGLQDIAMELVLVIPLSFALVALSAAALFYAGWWSPDAQLAVVLGLCMLGLVLQYVASRRATSSRE